MVLFFLSVFKIGRIIMFEFFVENVFLFLKGFKFWYLIVCVVVFGLDFD